MNVLESIVWWSFVAIYWIAVVWILFVIGWEIRKNLLPIIRNEIRWQRIPLLYFSELNGMVRIMLPREYRSGLRERWRRQPSTGPARVRGGRVVMFFSDRGGMKTGDLKDFNQLVLNCRLIEADLEVETPRPGFAEVEPLDVAYCLVYGRKLGDKLFNLHVEDKFNSR